MKATVGIWTLWWSLSVLSAMAQMPLQFQISGGIGGYRHVVHFPEFPGMEKSAAADPFDQANVRVAPFGGVGVLYGIAPSLRLGIEAVYADWSTQFAAMESIPAVRWDDRVVVGRVEHQLRISLTSFSLSPFIALQYLGVAISGGVALHWFPQRDYQYWELLRFPPEATFLEGGKQQLRKQQQIPGVRQPWLSGWIRFAIPLGKVGENFAVATFLQYRTGFSTLLPDQQWSVQTVSLGVQISSALWHATPMRIFQDTLYYRDTLKQYAPEARKDTIWLQSETVAVKQLPFGQQRVELVIIRQHYLHIVPLPEPLLSANVFARVVDRSGKEDTVLAIQGTAEEEVRIRSPLFAVAVPDTLPFPSMESLPLDSIRQWLWRHAALSPDAARRLLSPQLPFDTVLLYSIGSRRSTAMLPLQRYRLSQFLERTLHVPVQLRDTVDVEIQRKFQQFAVSGVNIFLIIPTPLRPLATIERDTVLISNVRKVRFYLRTVAEAGIRQWRLRVWIGKREFYFQGFGKPPKFVDWELAAFPLHPAQRLSPVRFLLEVEDFEGKKVHTPIGTIAFRIVSAEGNLIAGQRRYRFAFYPVWQILPAYDQVLEKLFLRIDELGGLHKASLVAPAVQIQELPPVYNVAPVAVTGYYPVAASFAAIPLFHPIWIVVQRSK